MFIKVKRINIPLVMVGTSTFAGSAQFGKNAKVYRKKFLNNTNTILEILEACYNAGGRGVHAVDIGKIVEASRIMKETHDDFIITGSTFPGPDPRIESLIDTGANLIFIHASSADRKDQKLNELIENISSRGVITGLAVHNPISTLRYSFENLPQIKAFLVPFNAKGLYMGKRIEVEKLIDQKKEYHFIGMKTLAAGKLTPSDAYQYISRHNICAAAIGMVTVQEAQITTKIALETFKKKNNAI